MDITDKITASGKVCRSLAARWQTLILHAERFARTTVIYLVCSLLSAQASPGQQNSVHNWNRVRNVPPGTSIWVKTKAGHTYHGELIAATTNSIQIEADERAFPGRISTARKIERQNVRQVREFNKGGSALAMSGIGAGLGAAIGVAVDRSARSKEDNGIAPVLFTLLGGLLGWGVGRHTTLLPRALIYAAP